MCIPLSSPSLPSNCMCNRVHYSIRLCYIRVTSGCVGCVYMPLRMCAVGEITSSLSVSKTVSVTVISALHYYSPILCVIMCSNTGVSYVRRSINLAVHVIVLCIIVFHVCCDYITLTWLFVKPLLLPHSTAGASGRMV